MPIARTDVTNLLGNERSRVRAAWPLVQSTAEAVRERRPWISAHVWSPALLLGEAAGARREGGRARGARVVGRRTRGNAGVVDCTRRIERRGRGCTRANVEGGEVRRVRATVRYWRVCTV